MNFSAVFANWTTKEAGLALALLAHFFWIVWWGSNLTSSVNAVAIQLERQSTVTTNLQRTTNDLKVRIAVEEALRNAGVGAQPPGLDTPGGNE